MQNVYTSSGSGIYLVASYTYDTNGNRAQVTYVNGDYTTYNYNQANLVTEVKNYTKNTLGATIISSDYTYTYRTDGNQLSKTDVITNQLTTYTYDDLGRLKSTTVKTGGTTNSKTDYAFDQYGNRSSMVVSSGGVSVTTNYTYDLNNRLTNETPSSGSAISYTYDKNGNQLTKGGTVNTYNKLGQLVSSTKGGVTTTYTYNPDGTRHSKYVPTDLSPMTIYIWQGGNIVAELNASGTIKATYTYGTNLICSNDGTRTKYYIFNAHGDVTGLANSIGVVIKSYQYDAFGNEIGANPSDTNPFRYAGQYFDKETGDYYLMARYYDPSDGRFTQQDGWSYANTKDPLSLNLYTYCMNDPVNLWDPMGHLTINGNGDVDADPSYWANPDNVWAYAQDHPYCNPKDTFGAPIAGYKELLVPGVTPFKSSSQTNISSHSGTKAFLIGMAIGVGVAIVVIAIVSTVQPEVAYVEVPLVTYEGEDVAALEQDAAAAAEVIGSEFLTKPNTAYFWSGCGSEGASIAEKIAEKNGGTTLEMLIKEKGIQLPEWSDDPAVQKIWRDASASYAQKASGVVRAVLGSNINSKSVWLQIELPALMKNKNVTEIISVDPITLVEKVIYKRG